MVEKNDNSIPEKKSIRNIPLTKKQTVELKEIEETMKDTPAVAMDDSAAPSRPVVRRKVVARTMSSHMKSDDGESPKRGGRGFLYTSGIVVILVLVYFIAHSFAHATVSIVRDEEIVVLSNNSFPLVAEGSTTTLAIQHKKVDLVKTASTTISATGQQTISKKAVGKVVIYNDSGSEQLLVATTRLQTPEGLIFRIDKSVTVPAKKNVTVNVTADAAGEKYNVGPKRFSLPGLAGTAKAKTVYGKSSTAMSGGSVSTVPRTSAQELTAAKTSMQQTLKDAVLEAAAESIPQGYDLLEGSAVITYGEIKQTLDVASKKAILTQTAQATIHYFERKSLAGTIAVKSSFFALATTTPAAAIDTASLSVKNIDSNSMEISGTSTVRSIFIPAQIATTVSRMSRENALRVVEAMPGVEVVEVSIKPWWERKLPKASSVEVIIE